MDINTSHSFKFYVKNCWMSSLCFFAILYLCLTPGSGLPKVDWNFFIPIDKMVHFTMFFGFSLLLTSDARKLNSSISTRSIWILLTSSAYGALIEIMQGTLTTTRTADVDDWIADTVGAIALTLLYALLLKLQRWTKLKVIA